MAIVASTINDTLVDALAPVHLDIINESDQHNVPPGSESHFKVVVVSDVFANESLISRHRRVNKLLCAELQGPIHALSLHTHTVEEWAKRGGRVPDSPPCRGGMAREK